MLMVICLFVIILVTLVLAVLIHKGILSKFITLKELTIYSLVAVLISCFACFMTVLTFHIRPSDYSENPVKVSSKNIINLKDNIDVEGKISGNLFYTQGYAENKLYYYYMKENDDNSFQAEKVLADDTKIRYVSEGQSPCLNTYYYYLNEDCISDYKNLRSFFIPFSDNWSLDRVTQKRKFAYYELCVPEGSVTTDFNIDLG